MAQPLTSLTLLAGFGFGVPRLTLTQIAAPPPAAMSSSLEDYTLSGGDNISIFIPQLEFKGDYQIPVGGTIILPLIGSVSVQGLNLTEITNQLLARYQQVLKRPQITVILTGTRPLNVWISGEVTRPGSYAITLTPGAGITPAIQFPTLMQALEKAQGVTQTADLRRVQLRRRLGNGTEQLFTLDLWEALQTGVIPNHLTLRDGDSIFVPTAIAFNAAEARQISQNSFATAIDKPRTVAVVGEVNRPGTYVVIGGNTAETGRDGLPTVTRAIQLAGGIKPQANLRNIVIRRSTAMGAEQIFEVNLWDLLRSGDITQDTIIQDGDTIIIAKATTVNPEDISELAEANFAPRTIRVSVIGPVIRPGLVELPPNTTLNQALLAGGGFTPRADNDTVDLIRLNFDGTVSKREIPVNLNAAINEDTNPILRNNDIIVASRSGMTKLVDTLNIAFEPAGAILSVLTIPESILRLLTKLGLSDAPL